ncbi:MAG: peptide chain release factor N(5)-glutamine methyltransferase [Candidatus Omnitrophica bacterium]|nr:peptide chain release factor N(5)-glutamine methyltransferase [Candidatus Omnitrophota bacterium]
MTEEELMLTTILQCDRAQLYTQPLQLTDQQADRLERMRQRRRQNEPLQYILGQAYFFGLTFKVDSRVLIPRPETELLVEHVLEFVLRNHGTDLRILDIGTGSGNIAISLAKSLPSARIMAIDISAEALTLARQNARLNQVAQYIDFAHCDFFEFIEICRVVEKSFDIIVANPPYIAAALLATLPEDVRQEPLLALDGGEDGLKFYRVLIAQARRFLKDKGVLACEIGDGQKESINRLLADNGFGEFYFKNDYRDTPRFFLAQV